MTNNISFFVVDIFVLVNYKSNEINANIMSTPNGVAICDNRNRDGTTNQKLKFVKTEFGIATIVIIGNYGKP